MLSIARYITPCYVSLITLNDYNSLASTLTSPAWRTDLATVWTTPISANWLCIVYHADIYNSCSSISVTHIHSLGSCWNHLPQSHPFDLDINKVWDSDNNVNTLISIDISNMGTWWLHISYWYVALDDYTLCMSKMIHCKLLDNEYSLVWGSGSWRISLWNL